MVREHQVHAAGVKIKVIAEVFVNHGGAFQVPARAAFPPRGGPEVVPVFRTAAFPQDEVRHGVLFIFVRVGPGVRGFAQVQFAFIQVGEFPVFRERGNSEVDGTVIRDIGVALFHQRLHHLNLFRNVAYRGGFLMRGKAVEGRAVLVEPVRPAGGEFRQGDAGLLGITDGLVIHIRQVADMHGGGSAQLHDAAENVLHDKGAEVADVGRAVHRGAAAVETQPFSIHGGNVLCRSGAGIVKV